MFAKVFVFQHKPAISLTYLYVGYYLDEIANAKNKGD